MPRTRFRLRRILGAAYALSIGWLFEILERFTPVRRDYWCFCTWPGYDHTLDNPRAVFEEIKNDPSIRKIVLLKDGIVSATHEGRNVIFAPAESWRGAYYLARSRVLLTGYALRALCSYSMRMRPERHQVIQLWHGVPLKRIGKLFPGEGFWEVETPSYAATVCSSSRDHQIMQQAFAPIPPERVWMTGLPRNDIILKPETELPRDYRSHLDLLEQQLRGRRLVLYAPTWRDSETSLYSFSADETDQLNDLLRASGAVLAIRGHSNVRSAKPYTAEWQSGLIINVSHVPDANLLLRRADVLITDYSSIYIDFLLLDRPILHFVYDLDDYQKERGFLYELSEAFAGPSARTFDELLRLLQEALVSPAVGVAQRGLSRSLFHQHSGRGSALRTCMNIQQLAS